MEPTRVSLFINALAGTDGGLCDEVEGRKEKMIARECTDTCLMQRQKWEMITGVKDSE